MKTIKLISRLVFVLLLIFCCKEKAEPKIISVKTAVSQTNNESTKTEDFQNHETASFTIKGMSCEMGCAKTIEKKLSKLDGMYKARVDFQKEMATVKYNPSIINEDLLTATVISLSQTSSYSVEEFQINKILKIVK